MIRLDPKRHAAPIFGIVLGIVTAASPLAVALPPMTSAVMMLSGYVIAMASLFLIFRHSRLAAWVLTVLGIGLIVAPVVPVTDPFAPINLIKSFSGTLALIVGLSLLHQIKEFVRIRDALNRFRAGVAAQLSRLLPP